MIIINIIQPVNALFDFEDVIIYYTSIQSISQKKLYYPNLAWTFYYLIYFLRRSVSIWLIARAAGMAREPTMTRRLTFVGPGRRTVQEHEDGVFEGRSIDDDQHTEGDGDNKDGDGTNHVRVFRFFQGRAELPFRLSVYDRTSVRKTPVLQ